VLAASRLRFASAVHNRIQGRSCRSTVGYTQWLDHEPLERPNALRLRVGDPPRLHCRDYDLESLEEAP